MYSYNLIINSSWLSTSHSLTETLVSVKFQRVHFPLLEVPYYRGSTVF